MLGFLKHFEERSFETKRSSVRETRQDSKHKGERVTTCDAPLIQRAERSILPFNVVLCASYRMEWRREGIAVVEGRKREINNFQPSRSKRVSNQREEEKLNMRVVRGKESYARNEKKSTFGNGYKKTFSLLLLEMMTYSFPPFAPIPVDIQCAFFPKNAPAISGMPRHSWQKPSERELRIVDLEKNPKLSSFSAIS